MINCKVNAWQKRLCNTFVTLVPDLFIANEVVPHMNNEDGAARNDVDIFSPIEETFETASVSLNGMKKIIPITLCSEFSTLLLTYIVCLKMNNTKHDSRSYTAGSFTSFDLDNVLLAPEMLTKLDFQIEKFSEQSLICPEFYFDESFAGNVIRMALPQDNDDFGIDTPEITEEESPVLDYIHSFSNNS